MTPTKPKNLADTLLDQFDGDHSRAARRAHLKASEYIHGRYPNESEGRKWRAAAREINRRREEDHG